MMGSMYDHVLRSGFCLDFAPVEMRLGIYMGLLRLRIKVTYQGHTDISGWGNGYG